MGVERLRFPEAIGAKEAREIRRYETEDIVTRFGVISPERIILNNYPVSSPASIFNASVIYNHEDDTLRIFARVIFGYYMYVSSIVGIDVPLNDVLNRYVNINRYTGNMIIYPSTRYDVWGAEDPRVYELNGKLYMTYVGRTINYFNAMIRRNRTIPITAIYDDDLRTWIKRFVISLSPEVFGEVISNKNAFFHLSPDGSLFFLHRPHLSDESFHLVASLVSDDEGLVVRGELKEIVIDNGIDVLRPSDFESKLGWAVPVMRVGDSLIALVHAVDKYGVVYRVFAVQLKFSKDEIIVEAVTPRYIMEPRTPYEVVGDRPLVVFPCGATRVGDDSIVVTYGAADYMIGFGVLSINNLLRELDRGRIY